MTISSLWAFCYMNTVILLSLLLSPKQLPGRLLPGVLHRHSHRTACLPLPQVILSSFFLPPHQEDLASQAESPFQATECWQSPKIYPFTWCLEHSGSTSQPPTQTGVPKFGGNLCLRFVHRQHCMPLSSVQLVKKQKEWISTWDAPRGLPDGKPKLLCVCRRYTS